MDEIGLFQAALGLRRPWRVARCDFSEGAGQLDIHIDFEWGGAFGCPGCGGAGCKAHDTEELKWRHLNFFQYRCYLHARTPRVRCGKCGVRRVEVPWARPGSGFTLLFEALTVMLARNMPVRAAARLLGEHDTLLWRMVGHHVDEARDASDHSGVTRVGVDETASRRGHTYMSVFVDLDRRRVLFATPGKDSGTVESFARDLEAHKGDPLAVAEASADMSAAFALGIGAHLPNAALTFDKFHVVALVNDSVDQVRRIEAKLRPELARTRQVWLKNPENLTGKQREKLDGLDLSRSNLKTARAYRIRLAFQDLYKQPAHLAEQYLDKWYYWATHSRLKPVVDAAKTIRRHEDGILRWFQSGVNNGILEAINSLIQAAKAKARGYRSDKNLATIIYLIAGKLDLPGLPT